MRKTLFGLSLKKEDPSEERDEKVERARLFVQGAVDQASEYRTPIGERFEYRYVGKRPSLDSPTKAVTEAELNSNTVTDNYITFWLVR